MEKIKQFVYHPVRSRFIFDFGITFVITLLVTSAFSYFTKLNIDFLFAIFTPVIFCTINSLLGLYSSYKLGSILEKSVILIVSGIFTALALYLFSFDPLEVVIVSFIIIICTVQPRIFLEINKFPSQIVQQLSQEGQKNVILVTGGGGFIGTILVEKLLKKGYKVRVLDKFIYGKEVFNNVQNKKNLILVKGDIADPFILTKSLLDVKAVIHLAGIVGDPAASLDENLTRHANIITTRMLKETVKAFNIQRFLFASTTAVYKSSLKLSSENSIPKASSVYTKTKLDSEHELLFDTHDSFHPTILRISTAFGHSRKPKFDLVANLFVAQAFTNGKIRVINGNQWRSFVHVTDIADSFIKVLEAPLNTVSRQIINIGNGSQRIQLKDLAKLVQRITSEKNRVKIQHESKKGAANYKISFSKLQKIRKDSKSISLEEGIKEVYFHFKKGTYKKPYTDPYYSSYEAAKKVAKEFYSKKYRKRHYSTLS